MATPYPTTYFPELSPVWLNYVAALNGAAPRPLEGGFEYLELGCGTGWSSVQHAAAYPAGRFHVCDADAGHAASARRYAHTLDVANLTVHETRLERLLDRALPGFDFIVLHGVYSWVDAATRRAIGRLIEHKLEPGGLVYVSYNCQPGWASEVPLRRLLSELAPEDAALPEAVRTLARWRAGGLHYFEAQPEAAAAVDSFAGSSVAYLAHEYLAGEWEVFYSIDVADAMHDVGLRYLGSATLADNHAELVLDAAAAAAIGRLADPRQRRLAVDFAVNRRFRRDVFVRDSAESAPNALLDAVIGCLKDPVAPGVEVTVPRGRLTFAPAFGRALGELLLRGSAPLRDVAAALCEMDGDGAGIVRNLLYLAAAGAVTPFARVHASVATPGAFTDSATAARFEQIAAGRAPGRVPSEVAGYGVAISREDAREVVDAVRSRRCRPSPALIRCARLGLLA